MRELGIILFSSLSSEYHINYIVSKSPHTLGFLTRTSRKGVDTNAMTVVYKSLVRSSLNLAVSPGISLSKFSAYRKIKTDLCVGAIWTSNQYRCNWLRRCLVIAHWQLDVNYMILKFFRCCLSVRWTVLLCWTSLNCEFQVGHNQLISSKFVPV